MLKPIIQSSVVLAIFALLGSAAIADFFESFEGGDSTGWAAIGTETILATDLLPAAASDGTYALQVTSSTDGWDEQLKRENILPQLQANDTLELSIYVPALDTEGGAWANADLVINTEGSGFQSSSSHTPGSFSLSQGMNHLSWNYGADSVTPSGAWGIFELVTNVSSPNPISPYYIDSFRLSNSVPEPEYKSSWENSNDGWALMDDGIALTPVDAAGGAPAGAITDGDYALRVAVDNKTDWTQLIQLNTASGNQDALTAMKENDTVEFDLFVEAGEILPEQFTTIGLVLNHPSTNGDGFMANYTTLDFSDTGSTYHVSWNYGADPNYDSEVAWAQFNFLTVADDTSNGADPISEFYIDNFRFTTAPEGTPGDYNDDGTVDAADYTVWRDNLGSSNALPNDPTGGVIGEAQYATWTASMAGASLTGASSVPEPSSVVLLLAIVGGGLCMQVRR